MTKEEFEKSYAEKSNIDLEIILKRLKAIPCNCGEDNCNGWQMIN